MDRQARVDKAFAKFAKAAGGLAGAIQGLLRAYDEDRQDRGADLVGHDEVAERLREMVSDYHQAEADMLLAIQDDEPM